ncbi:putative receptor-like protein kinase At3g47110 [Hevea brasiliensis]|uniref:putative receptor-like protein kinase At3g47110 n=1 Tax=Hevea brasiliensis TaxID=3981 RepID=UPI0025CE71BA|nr:putative receptor-like protein kinase At3g47110 [Hevea brasiliensis]
MELPTIHLANLWPSILHVHFIFLSSMSIQLLQPANSLSKMGNETDRLALLQFKAKIGNDPYGILSSWNDSVNFCSWQGVACGHKHQRVLSLNMQGLSLSGTISPYIGNFTFLRFLNLVDNKFYGEIPLEVGRLFRLRILDLSNNTLGGEIPLKITYSSELKVLNLTRNRLEGKIPAELGSLKKLVTLRLGTNNLTGEIPQSLGNLSSLKVFSVGFNNLHGNIPSELGQLTSLIIFVINFNNLSGTIPPTLYNISSISLFYTSSNKLSGSLPANLGLTLHNLQQLAMGGNQFHGSVPVSLANASQLQDLDISRNFLTGQVPTNLGNLNDLQRFSLGHNFLGNSTSQDFNFITSLSNCSNLKILFFSANNFGGLLPPSIANLSTLYVLGMGSNHISGKIPIGVENLVNLYELAMEINLFSGVIPFSFGKLGKLQLLNLGGNLLSGEIPTSLGNPELQLPPCPIQKKKQKKTSTIIILVTTISSVVFFMTITCLCVFYRRKSRRNPLSNSRTLNLLQRLHIAIDVASALNYLHDHCEVPIIHCDLKPSNILLDSGMTAHVGDFGLARFLTKTTSCSSQGQTSSIGMKGTIGYMAPEYGIGSEATISGDVYSFGVILLEMFTGKRPIEEMFTDGLNLHNFVKAKLPRRVMQVVDPVLLTTGELGTPTNMAENMDDNDIDDTQIEIQEHDFSIENLGSKGEDVKKCVVLVLELGLACSVEVPGDRMNMRDITRKLNVIMEAILRLRTQRGK